MREYIWIFHLHGDMYVTAWWIQRKKNNFHLFDRICSSKLVQNNNSLWAQHHPRCPCRSAVGMPLWLYRYSEAVMCILQIWELQTQSLALCRFWSSLVIFFQSRTHSILHLSCQVFPQWEHWHFKMYLSLLSGLYSNKQKDWDNYGKRQSTHLCWLQVNQISYFA